MTSAELLREIADSQEAQAELALTTASLMRQLADVLQRAPEEDLPIDDDDQDDDGQDEDAEPLQ